MSDSAICDGLHIALDIVGRHYNEQTEAATVARMNDDDLSAAAHDRAAAVLGSVIDGIRKALFDAGERDRCEECHGEKGGVPGNENIVDGRVLCDYCTSALIRAERGDP